MISTSKSLILSHDHLSSCAVLLIQKHCATVTQMRMPALRKIGVVSKHSFCDIWTLICIQNELTLLFLLNCLFCRLACINFSSNFRDCKVHVTLRHIWISSIFVCINETWMSHFGSYLNMYTNVMVYRRIVFKNKLYENKLEPKTTSMLISLLYNRDVWRVERKGKRSDSVLWQKPLHSEKSKKQHINTKHHQKLRFHNDCWPT